MPQITFPHGDAHKALDEFLSGDAEGQESHSGRRWTRNISTPDGRDLAAVIVDPALHAELMHEAAAWREHLEPKRDQDLPPGYRPYQHAPTAEEDRLLPVEPLKDPLSRIFFGKPHEELGHDEQLKVLHASILCLRRVTLDPDDTGAVPILMRAHNREDRDAPQARLLWQIAYKTDVPGLFVRVTGNGFFGEQWGIVTGSGFRLRSGWDDRESAAQAVAALGRVLPQVDWMGVTNASVFTPNALAAIKQVFLRYRDSGIDEKQPEPEPAQDSALAATAAPAENTSAPQSA